MKSPLIASVLVLAAVLIVATIWLWTQPHRALGTSQRTALPLARLIDLGRGDEATNGGFATVEAPWEYRFPADHGAHERFRTEAWYFTGQVRAVAPPHQRYGLQLALFRLAVSPPPSTPNRAAVDEAASRWRFRHLYRGHLALTDITTGRFFAFERLSRASLGLAGHVATPPKVWLESWQLSAATEADPQHPRFELSAQEAPLRLQLQLAADKALIPADGAANLPFYGYMLPRLTLTGELTIEGRPVEVVGTGWLDRSWGGLPLLEDDGGVALNRFLIQLDDRRELALFQLHRRDGSGNPALQGLLIDPSGGVKSLERQEVKLETLHQWQSPDGVAYPAGWRVDLPYEQTSFTVTPTLADQELRLSLRYWSGSVAIVGEHRGRPLTGQGHVDLTGYAADTLAF